MRLCRTVAEFEREEERRRRERGMELARRGLSAEQIAERLGCSVRAARRWAREARA